MLFHSSGSWNLGEGAVWEKLQSTGRQMAPASRLEETSLLYLLSLSDFLLPLADLNKKNNLQWDPTDEVILPRHRAG